MSCNTAPKLKAEFQKILPMIEKWEVERLDLDSKSLNRNDPKIVTGIRMIEFSHLELLNLARHDLASVEGLHRMHMPNLKYFYLSKHNSM